MPIASRKENGAFVFIFDRIIAGVRHRTRRRLPKAWSRAQADAHDRQEVGRLYAVATGLERSRHTIDNACALYARDKAGLKSIKSAVLTMASTYDIWRGRAIEDLPQVCAEIARITTTVDQQGRTRKLAPQTTKNRIAVLRAACRWGWREHDLCEHDPAAKVRVPKVDNERQVYRTRAEVLRIARACSHALTRAVILTAFYSGMRLAEILRAEPRGDVFELADTKNGRPRHVPIHPKIRVYVRKAGRWPVMLAKRTIQTHYMRARDAAGFPGTHLHDLRHSTASALVNAGVDLFVVGQILGHADPRSTQRYSHLRTDRMAEAMNALSGKSPNIVPRGTSPPTRDKAA